MKGAIMPPSRKFKKYANRKLYDIAGRNVGTYQGDRIGEGLSAGVYFLRPVDGSAKPVRVVKVR